MPYVYVKETDYPELTLSPKCLFCTIKKIKIHIFSLLLHNTKKSSKYSAATISWLTHMVGGVLVSPMWGFAAFLCFIGVWTEYLWVLNMSLLALKKCAFGVIEKVIGRLINNENSLSCSPKEILTTQNLEL